MKKKDPFGYEIEDEIGVPAERRGPEARVVSAEPGASHIESDSIKSAPVPPPPWTLVSREPRVARFMPLGFSAMVSAGSTKFIEVMPQLTFKGRLLVVGSSCVSAFHINELRVGHSSQFVTSDAVSAECFLRMDKINLESLDSQKVAYLATMFGMDMATAQIGSRIVLSVTNFYGAPCMFSAALYGESLFP